MIKTHLLLVQIIDNTPHISAHHEKRHVHSSEAPGTPHGRQVISMEEQLTLDVPKDSRRKAKLRRDDESARLMYTTCQLISMDQIMKNARHRSAHH